MKLNHPELGQLRFVQSTVHSSLAVSQDTRKDAERKRKATVRFEDASTVIQDHGRVLSDVDFPTPLGLMAVYVDDLLVAAPLNIMHFTQTAVDLQGKTGSFQVLGEDSCERAVSASSQGSKDTTCSIRDEYQQSRLVALCWYLEPDQIRHGHIAE
eukprot:5572654-Amphidinium_carterae.3